MWQVQRSVACCCFELIVLLGPDRESHELADAFNAMAERVQRSEMLRRRAASDMAHDLATPATVLESQLQAMVDGVVPADREQLDRARAAAAIASRRVARETFIRSASSRSGGRVLSRG